VVAIPVLFEAPPLGSTSFRIATKISSSVAQPDLVVCSSSDERRYRVCNYEETIAARAF
jgi:hypothetical protein